MFFLFFFLLFSVSFFVVVFLFVFVFPFVCLFIACFSLTSFILCFVFVLFSFFLHSSRLILLFLPELGVSDLSQREAVLFPFPNGCTIKSLSCQFLAQNCAIPLVTIIVKATFFFVCAVNSIFMGDSKKLGLLDRFSFNQNMVPSYPYKHSKWCQICSKIWSRFLGT